MKATLLYSLLYLTILILSSACSEIKLEKAGPAVKSVRIKVASYCPEDGRSLVNVFALNLSSQTAADKILLDTDRDGLSDEFEKIVSIRDEYDISYLSRDANGDGYSDLLTYNIGYKVDNQQALAVCEQPELDTDRDLLSDCEEDILGTDPKNPDTDNDGIPDGIEFRYMLNPLDSLDSGIDLDGDGMNNLEEVIYNSLPYINFNTQPLKHKVHYNVEAFLNQEDKQCYEVLVSNIPLVDVSNGNKIQLFFLERENVQGQQQVNFLRDITVISSRALSDGHLIQVPDVQNQTVIETIN